MMSLPRFLVPSLVLLAVSLVCPATAEAGGLLQRLFGHRHCRPVKTFQPVSTCCVATPQPACACGSAVGTATMSVPPDCVPCMRGNGVSNGDPDLCKDQRDRDEECCQRHADDEETYEACMKLAELREQACKIGVPLKVKCPRAGSSIPKSYDCNCDHCGSNYGCQYNCNYQCWLTEYCATCDPMLGHDCSICLKKGDPTAEK